MNLGESVILLPNGSVPGQTSHDEYQDILSRRGEIWKETSKDFLDEYRSRVGEIVNESKVSGGVIRNVRRKEELLDGIVRNMGYMFNPTLEDLKHLGFRIDSYDDNNISKLLNEAVADYKRSLDGSNSEREKPRSLIDRMALKASGYRSQKELNEKIKTVAALLLIQKADAEDFQEQEQQAREANEAREKHAQLEKENQEKGEKQKEYDALADALNRKTAGNYYPEIQQRLNEIAMNKGRESFLAVSADNEEFLDLDDQTLEEIRIEILRESKVSEASYEMYKLNDLKSLLYLYIHGRNVISDSESGKFAKRMIENLIINNRNQPLSVEESAIYEMFIRDLRSAESMRLEKEREAQEKASQYQKEKEFIENAINVKDSTGNYSPIILDTLNKIQAMESNNSAQISSEVPQINLSDELFADIKIYMLRVLDAPTDEYDRTDLSYPNIIDALYFRLEEISNGRELSGYDDPNYNFVRKVLQNIIKSRNSFRQYKETGNLSDVSDKTLYDLLLEEEKVENIKEQQKNKARLNNLGLAS